THDGDGCAIPLDIHVQVAVEVGDVEQLLQVVRRDVALLLQTLAAGGAHGLLGRFFAHVVISSLHCRVNAGWAASSCCPGSCCPGSCRPDADSATGSSAAPVAAQASRAS